MMMMNDNRCKSFIIKHYVVSLSSLSMLIKPILCDLIEEDACTTNDEWNKSLSLNQI
jgi:hypothetical protein